MNFWRCTLTACATVTALWIATPSAFASDRSDILAVLHHWDENSSADCADDATVIDDFPPFEWHGADACAKWQKDADAYEQANGITEAAGPIGEPRELIITGDGAYAVVPVTFAYTQKGKPVKETATVTFALHKTASSWRITAWVWATLDTK